MPLHNGVEAPRWIVVDFDGTLCTFAYPGIGAPKPGAKQAMQRLRDLGFYVTIMSCRTCKFFPEIFAPNDAVVGHGAQVHKDMVAWLDANEIPYDEVDDGVKGKPMADYYIDDKGIRYDDNWAEVVQFIEGRM